MMSKVASPPDMTIAQKQARGYTGVARSAWGASPCLFRFGNSKPSRCSVSNYSSRKSSLSPSFFLVPLSFGEEPTQTCLWLPL